VWFVAQLEVAYVGVGAGGTLNSETAMWQS